MLGHRLRSGLRLKSVALVLVLAAAGLMGDRLKPEVRLRRAVRKPDRFPGGSASSPAATVSTASLPVW